LSLWPSPWPDSSGGSVAGLDFGSRNLCHRLVDGMQMAAGSGRGQETDGGNARVLQRECMSRRNRKCM